MPKSKYPDKLDTSVEIPVIRDNITEIGSDVFNSLRSAIFNIERSLGINPQGATGNSVAARLSNALDENGNILKEALDRSNVLSGPITDADVSKVAAVDESKLRLDYPTQLLQDEISILDNRLNLFIEALEELNAIVSAHVHPDAINRHYAKAVTVEAAEVEESSVAATSLGEGSLQEILEEIYNAHIHYTGESIDANNNSHKALQVYYDNDDTSDLIPSSSVQGAIDDLALLEGQALRNSILNFNSNGIIRTGSTHDGLETMNEGTVLVESNTISWNVPSGESKMRISFSDNPTPIVVPKEFDVLTIIDSPNDDDNADYLISSVDLTSGNDMAQVEIYGGPKNVHIVGTTGKITRSIYTIYNENGFNCSVRPRHNKSNTPDIQVALPNAATVISSGIRPTSLVDGSGSTLSIEIDNGSAVEIGVFDSDYTVQTVDTIVNKINEYAVTNRLNIFAYKMRSLRCYELAITHTLPNFAEDIANRTLKVVSGSNDAATALGMSYLIDREVEGSTGNAYHINGRLLEEFGQIKRYLSETISISAGTMELRALAGDFLVNGIRAGDLCVIQGSTDSNDDGTYRIHSVASSTLSLDACTVSSFGGSISEDSAVFIVRCTAPVGEMEFEEPSDQLILFDVFVDQNKDIFYKRRLDQIGHLDEPNFYALVSDVTRSFIKEDDVYVLTIDVNGMASISLQSSGISGESIFVGSTGSYKIYSVDKMAYIVLEVFVSGIAFPIAADITSELKGYSETPDSVLHLCRGVYSTRFGFILGSPDSIMGLPKVIDKRTTGTVDDTIIAEPLLERYIQGPRNELRGSGIIRNADVEAVVDGSGNCALTINPGIVVANGVRFEFLGHEELIYKYDDGVTNNFYVGIDGHGCVVIANEVDPAGGVDYISPFVDQVIAHLAYIEPVTETVWDLRLFVDHLDYKLIADITVANDQRFGHFTNIKTAIDYAEMFSKIFPNVGTPSILIKEGTHEVSEKLLISFDLKISGSGPQTIIKRSEDFPLPNTNMTSSGGYMFLIGGHDIYSRLQHGVTFQDCTFEGTFGQDVSGNGMGTFIEVRHDLDIGNSPTANFIFNNLKFIAADDYGMSASSTAGVPNQMPFHIGSGSSRVFQNITISNCYFDGVGYEKGVIYLNTNNTYKNINISNNISINSIDVDACGNTLLRDGGTSTLINVQEVNNMIIDVNA